MQVFVPLSSSLADSVMCLDRSRAGNQCWRESVTLLNGGWAHHPAHQLFADAPGAFAEYNVLLIDHVYDQSWCTPRTHHKWRTFWLRELDRHSHADLPAWWGDERVHASHRGCLLAKDPDWYGRFGWSETPTPPDPVTDKWPYVWPEELT